MQILFKLFFPQLLMSEAIINFMKEKLKFIKNQINILEMKGELGVIPQIFSANAFLQHR